MLRSACITLVSSLICLPNFYAGNATSVKNSIYLELKYQIQTVFQKALKREKATRNLQQLLWSTSVLIFEEINNNPEVAPVFVMVLLDLLKDNAAKPLRDYEAEVFVTIYEVFSSLTPLYQQIENTDPDFARRIVDQLAVQIPLQASLLSNSQTKAKIVEESLYCICDLIMVGYERIFANHDTLSKVIAAIEVALNIERKISPSEDTIHIKLAGEFVLSHMLNHAGHYPPCPDSTSAQIASSVKESDEAFDLKSPDESEYVRFFVFADLFVFSIIEQPDEKGGPGVTILVRDLAGKYCWDARLLFGEDPSPYSQLSEFGRYTGSSSYGLTGHVQEHEDNETLMRFSHPPAIRDREDLDLFEQLIDVQESTEAATFEAYRETFNQLDISAKPPTLKSKYTSENRASMSRLLLSQMGFLSLASQKNFVQLHSNMKLMRSLVTLDKTQPRDTHKIALVYVANGQDDQMELFYNEDASERFKQFVKSMTWEVPLNIHGGFMGGLDKNGSTGEAGPYYSDYRTEVMFHVPTMMPTSQKEPQQIHKKRHVGNDHVNVIWTEHSRDYFKGTIISQFNFIHIIVYPMKQTGLYRVDVLVKEKNTPVFGPICHGMILSERILGELIRLTSVNGNRIVRGMSTGYTKPYLARKKLISEIVERYKSDLDTDWYYGSLFVNKAISNEVVNNSGAGAPKKGRAVKADSPTPTKK